MPELTTRGFPTQVYRLKPECWAQVDLHSLCVRTRKEQHQVELRMAEHAREGGAPPPPPARGAGAETGETPARGRPPWVARHGVPLRRELAGGIAGVARSAGLMRAVFMLLHNAARSLDTTGAVGGAVGGGGAAGSAMMGAGLMGWGEEPALARSSEMLVRQAVHLLFLALDLQQGDGASMAGGAMARDSTAGAAPGVHVASPARAYYQGAEAAHLTTATLGDGMDVDTGAGISARHASHGPAESQADAAVARGGLARDLCATVTPDDRIELEWEEALSRLIAEARLNRADSVGAAADVLDPAWTGLPLSCECPGPGAGLAETPAAARMPPAGAALQSVLGLMCHEYVIADFGGFADEAAAVSHSSIHAVSHTASIISLLVG